MRKFSLSKQFQTNPPITSRVSTVMRMFGLTLDRLKNAASIHKAVLEVREGDIVYITGPSGSGKSVLLRELLNEIPAGERISIDEIELPADRAAVDCIHFGQTGQTCLTGQTKALSTVETLRLLSICGISDAFCMLIPPANLSEGQKYRFRLACCLASGKKYVFADEFASSLDRITAAVIAYNVRKFAKRTGVTFVLASSHEDILADLQPDVLVVNNFASFAEVLYKKLRTKN
ncbi:MAG: ATP-binding cassette domain-containing protein [Sedimentisphaerales bacterium]|nr:ATP-binding cassette domain-containing protein [Sedimentisphaerales bacterium]